MIKEIKLVPWESREDLIDVINTRSSIMKSGLNTNQNFIDLDINRLDIYSHHMCFGLYEDGVLDCFKYIHLWSEFNNTYSNVTYSRAKEGRVKLDNGYDVNITELHNYTAEFLEKKDYYNMYVMVNGVDWKHLGDNEHSRYNKYDRMVVEEIPAGKTSQSSIFRHRLSSRMFDVPVQVVFYSLPLELRVND